MPRPAKPKGPGRPCKELPKPTWAELDDILMVAFLGCLAVNEFRRLNN